MVISQSILNWCSGSHIGAGKYISDDHHISAWQRTELWQVYSNTGKKERDRVIGADRDTAETYLDRATGSIY